MIKSIKINFVGMVLLVLGVIMLMMGDYILGMIVVSLSLVDSDLTNKIEKLKEK